MEKIVELERTCPACPVQWEGKLEDGRFLYVRYRWGELRVYVSPEASDNVKDAVNGELLLCKQYGDALDGFMDDETMLGHLKEEGLMEYEDA